MASTEFDNNAFESETVGVRTNRVSAADSYNRKASSNLKTDTPKGNTKDLNAKDEAPKVGLQRTVGLASGISIIIGTMIGSGIFVSPKGVLYASGSIGLCLIIWVLCGIVSLLGALCYAELGTLISESGGEFIYILRGFNSVNKHVGRILAFLYSWSAAVILKPTSFAAICLACSLYVLGPLTGKCGPPALLVKIGAFLIMTISSLLNAYSVKLTNKVLVTLTFAKIAALVIVIIGGIVRLFQGYTENFTNSFEGTTTDVLTIAGGFYGGLWAFDGWNNLNYVTEEIINPKRNLPLSIFISLPLCTVIYVLVNISYFTVMSKEQLLASDAVGVTWGNEVLGNSFKWVLPLSVALSTFGSATGSLFSSARLNFVAAREGLLVKSLAMVNVKRNTPDPSIIFTFVIAVLFLIPADLDALIDIFSFTMWIYYGLTTAALLIMRFTMKNIERVVKIPIVIPIFVFLISVYLVFAPVIDNPRIEYLGAIGIVLFGLVFYVPFIHFKWELPYFGYVTIFIQNLLEVALPDKEPQE